MKKNTYRVIAPYGMWLRSVYVEYGTLVDMLSAEAKYYVMALALEDLGESGRDEAFVIGLF